MKKNSFYLTVKQASVVFGNLPTDSHKLLLNVRSALVTVFSSVYPTAFKEPGITFAQEEKLLAEAGEFLRSLKSFQNPFYLEFQKDLKELQRLQKEMKNVSLFKRIHNYIMIQNLEQKTYELDTLLEGAFFERGMHPAGYWDICIHLLEKMIVIRDDEII